MNSGRTAPSHGNTPALRVLVTAGPTHEPIDRVRYLGNRSSGRMGLALAEACIARDWPVTLLLGPAAISPPHHSHLAVHRFQTAADLQRLLHEHWPSHDLLLMAAAVADYTVAGVKQDAAAHESKSRSEKIKRSGDRLTLELVATPDLLAGLASITRPDQFVVGFALEPASTLATEAARKLRSKRLDAIVANPLETMDAPDVSATLLFADGRNVVAPPVMAKKAFAQWLLDQLATYQIDDTIRTRGI